MLDRRLSLLAFLALAGCPDQREEQTSETMTQTTQMPTVTSLDTATGESTQANETSTSAASTTPTSVDTGDKLDVGAGTGMMEGGDTEVCQKVDMLFVVDDSGSMEDEQDNLTMAFPAFIGTIQTELDAAVGYNIGVIRTDANDISCVAGRAGVLVTRNFLAASSNMTCTPYASGYRYMTEADNLVSKFSCAAKVGIGGSGDEKPIESLIAALTSPNIDAGECNENFLRDDALLVIVIITDEEDDHESDMGGECEMTPGLGSAGDPPDWYEDIIAIKGGIETNIVMLSLVGVTEGTPCPALDKCNGGVTGAEPAPRLVELTQMFTHGHVGRVCGQYDPFFEEAVADIKAACEDFIPPG